VISKQAVHQAWLKVKANKGKPGIDGVTLELFEKDLKNNLYKIWNRMASGSYFPPAVKRVEIPKGNGEMRPLGVPTVGDRVAQTVAKEELEKILEPVFHFDSYGYRPCKSAHEALEQARRRCWEYDWVVDLDIKGFFDNLDHELLLKAVNFHSPPPWVVLYIERWLTAPTAYPDGRVEVSQKGSPQGGVISPLLANLFLHYALDSWLVREYPQVRFERYADDAVIHCQTQQEVEGLLRAVKERLSQCHLQLHPDKTKIVYCKDSNRPGHWEQESFDFLSFTFRPRLVKSRQGVLFVSFTPAISNKAKKAIFGKIREWNLKKRTQYAIEIIVAEINPIIRGWMQYYGKFCPSALHRIWTHIDWHLVKWACRKHKPYRGRSALGWRWLGQVRATLPKLLVHWT